MSTRFSNWLHQSFDSLGRWVSRNSIAVICFSLSLTVLCTLKTLNTKKESDILAYAPRDARSRTEFALYGEFFDHSGQGITNYVLIEARDNGTLLRLAHLNETVRILDRITRGFKIENLETKRNDSFDEFCSGFCQINEPIRQFYNGFVIQDAARQSGRPLNPRIQLRYPTSSMFGRKFTIQSGFFGVELYSEKELTTVENSITNIKKCSLIVLQLRADRQKGWNENAVIDYELSLANYFANEYSSDILSVLVISPSYVSKEIERAGLSLEPLLIVGFLSMLLFTIATTAASSSFVHQFNHLKIILAVSACIVPLISCVTAFGLLFSVGLRFGPIIAVTPFLILAIGVDDSFLMLHAWQRAVGEWKHSKEPNRIEKTIGMVCAEAGPSITLSSITNILAFGVGALTSTPEIQLFSIVNGFAIFVDTVYSLTLYAAIMAVCGKFENYEPLEAKIAEAEEPKWKIRTRERFYSLLDSYVSVLGKFWFSAFVMISLVMYWIVTGWGASQMGIDLSSEKFFLKDSVLLKADFLKQHYVIPHFTAPAFFVNNPGNLSDERRVSQLGELVSHLESLPDSIGPESTKFFLPDFFDYLNAFAEMDEESKRSQIFDADSLESFLKWPEYSFWRGFLRIRNSDGHQILEKFFFTVGYGGNRLREWSQRHAILEDWRRAVDLFPQFNVSVFYEDALFLDLIDVLPSSTWQSALATLLCMFAVCVVFMFDCFSVAVASVSIFSICLGEFGLLHFCGITLDPIMIAALIMSIGFSVDIPAHICYHYHRTNGQNEEERIRKTLAAVGFPVFQAGISTILCVICLLLVPLYMSEVFVLCMAFCIGLGLLHGLLIIPSFILLSSKICRLFSQKR